jgi:hypothetical protein
MEWSAGSLGELPMTISAAYAEAKKIEPSALIQSRL